MAIDDYNVKPFTLPVEPLPIAYQVRNNDNLLRAKFVQHQEDKVAHIQSGTTASRPASGTIVGETYIATDTGVVSIWNGTAWVTEWSYAKLSSDFTTLNSTLTDITGLSFTPESSMMYEFEAMLMIQTATATNNPRTGVAWPTAGVVGGAAQIYQTGLTTGTLVYQSGNSSAAIQIPAGDLPAGSTTYPALIKGVISMTTGASGSVRLQMAAETAGTVMTVKAGSFLKYRTF